MDFASFFVFWALAFVVVILFLLVAEAAEDNEVGMAVFFAILATLTVAGMAVTCAVSIENARINALLSVPAPVYYIPPQMLCLNPSGLNFINGTPVCQ